LIVGIVADCYAPKMRKTQTIATMLVSSLVLRCLLLQTQRPVPQNGQTWNLPTSASDTLEMIWIPSGTFTMGSPQSDPCPAPMNAPKPKSPSPAASGSEKTIFTIGQWKAVTGLDVRGQLSKAIHDDTLYDLGGKKTDRARTFHAILPRRRSRPIFSPAKICSFRSISSVGTTRWISAKN